MAAVTLGEKVLLAKSIICDIEGTTTSISFVKDTLFPYALKNVEDYLKKNWNEDATKTVVAALREQADEDKKAEVEGVVAIPAGDSEDIIADIVKNVEWQMSQDRKTGSLKTLQGLVWAKGYKDGTIKGHVYDDVQKSFEKWTECGRKIYIYSSGSVDAQKLLFENSEQGNLLKYLAGHYDTKIGAKREKESYNAILKNIDAPAEEAVFLTDVFAEAKAAKGAGLNVVLLDRPGNSELSEEERKEFPVITTFSDLSFEEAKEENGSALNGKRKIEETTETPEEDKTQEPPTKVVKVDDSKKADSAENGKTEDKATNEASKDITEAESKKEETVTEKEGEKMEVDGGDLTVEKADVDKTKKEAMEEGEETTDTLITKSEEKKEKQEETKEEKQKDETVVDAKASVVTSQSSNELSTGMELDKPEIKDDGKGVLDTPEDSKACKEDSQPTGKNEEGEELKEMKENEENIKKADVVLDAKKTDDMKDDKEVKEIQEVKEIKEVKEIILKSHSSEEKIEKTQQQTDTKEATELKQTDKKEELPEKSVDVQTGVALDSSAQPDEVSTELKEDEKVAAAGGEESEKIEKVDEDVPAVATSEKTEAPKSNGNKTEENPATNGSSGGDEEKNGDSDKENDTNNCETDDVSATVAEKTNGSTGAVESSGNGVPEAATAEIKPKKVVDVVAPAATPTPPIEAES